MKKIIDKALQYVGLAGKPEPLFDTATNYPPMPVPVAAFYSEVCRIKDADTLEVEINKHHHCKQYVTIRLLGIDAPETRGPEKVEGLSAKQFAEAWVQEGKDRATHAPFVVQTVATDKYGRWLAWVWRTCDKANLNMDLLNTGHADSAPMTANQFLMRDVTYMMKGIDVD